MIFGLKPFFSMYDKTFSLVAQLILPFPEIDLETVVFDMPSSCAISAIVKLFFPSLSLLNRPS